MLAEKRVSTKLEARCPGCLSTHQGEILPFLYADELGYRCPTCGDVLAVGAGDRREPSGPCLLLLPEGLAGSGLHRKLTELAGSGEGLRVLVDRTGGTRTVRPEYLPQPKGFGFAAWNGTS